MSIPFDAPFIGAFLITTIVVAGVIGMGVFNLIKIRDPKPVEPAAQES